MQRNAGFVYREFDYRLSGLSVSWERPIHRTDEGKHRALRFSERNGSLPRKGHFRSVTLRLTFRLVLGGPQDHLLLPICNTDARSTRTLPTAPDATGLEVEHVAGACQLSGVAARYHHTIRNEEQGA